MKYQNNRTRGLIVFLTVVLVLLEFGSLYSEDLRFALHPKGIDMDAFERTLKSEKDRDALVKACRNAALSGDKAALNLLQAFLLQPQSMARLEAVEVLTGQNGETYELHLEETRSVINIVTDIGRSNSPHAREIILELGSNKWFKAEPWRFEGVLRGLGWLEAPASGLKSLVNKENTQDFILQAYLRDGSPGSRKAILDYYKYYISKHKGQVIKSFRNGQDYMVDLRVLAIHTSVSPRRIFSSVTPLHRFLIFENHEPVNRNAAIDSLFRQKGRSFFLNEDAPILPPWYLSSTSTLLDILKLADDLKKDGMPKEVAAVVTQGVEDIKRCLKVRYQSARQLHSKFQTVEGRQSWSDYITDSLRRSEQFVNRKLPVIVLDSEQNRLPDHLVGKRVWRIHCPIPIASQLRIIVNDYIASGITMTPNQVRRLNSALMDAAKTYAVKKTTALP